MADSFEIAYLYARVCGAFSKMRLGEAGRELMRNPGGIPALWKLYFNEEPPTIPESKLIFEAERKIIQRSISSFLRLAKPLSDSDVFIHTLISKYEITAIKSMLFRMRSGEPRPEEISYTSPVIEQALSAWPRLADMFYDTPYAWLDTSWLDNIALAENKLDRQYYLDLWATASRIPKPKLGAILDLVRWEIVYQNVIWALRIRRYYNMSRQDATSMLVDIKGVETTSLALQTFDFDIDRLDSFDSWPLKKLLSNQTSARLDVPVLEIRAQEELFTIVRRALHLHPFSYTPVYCYFKLLEYETSLLLAVLESARLGVTAEQKSKYLWIPGEETA